jgi:hypothetical protein
MKASTAAYPSLMTKRQLLPQNTGVDPSSSQSLVIPNGHFRVFPSIN